MKLKIAFLTLMVVIISHNIYGQIDSIRKVAILETVDRENKINYGVKLMVRSNLAAAITNTPGYEGYDRVDIAAIMGEQDFQRTGMVNDAQIKKLGEMTGAADILVAEVAMVDATHIIITAKILDVESAKLRQTAYAQTSTNPQNLEIGCQTVAATLLGRSSTKTKTEKKEGRSNIGSYIGTIGTSYKESYKEIKEKIKQGLLNKKNLKQ